MCFVTDISALLDFLSRTAHGNLYLHRILEQSICQFFYLLRHSGGEHDGLTVGGQLACYHLDVLREAHVQHAVCFVKYEEAHLAEVGATERDMADESSRCGDDHIGSHLEALQLLIIAVAVVAAIHSHAAYSREVIAEALHGLIDLLCQLSSRTHNHAVDGILRISSVVQLREDRKEISSCLSRSGLCYTEEVASLKDWGNTLFLNRCAFVETHII